MAQIASDEDIALKDTSAWRRGKATSVKLVEHH
jgi:hypothetical protein